MSDKPFSVSYSKMSTFRRCLQQYHWKYMDKFFPPSGIGQARGTAGHAALASWHQNYQEEAALNAAWENWSGAGYQHDADWQLLEDALRRYFPWSRDHDKFVLKAAEQKFEITYEIPWAYDRQDPDFVEPRQVVLTGFMDGIVEEDGALWVLENKFYKRMENNDNPMDAQVSIYMLACHTLGMEVQGVIYNKVRVADSKIAITEPVVRTRQYRNPAGLQQVETEMLAQIQSMLAYHERGGSPYKNVTKDCAWDCPFHQACLSMTDDGINPTQMLISICNVRRNDDPQEVPEQSA